MLMTQEPWKLEKEGEKLISLEVTVIPEEVLVVRGETGVAACNLIIIVIVLRKVDHAEAENRELQEEKEEEEVQEVQQEEVEVDLFSSYEKVVSRSHLCSALTFYCRLPHGSVR